MMDEYLMTCDKETRSAIVKDIKQLTNIKYNRIYYDNMKSFYKIKFHAIYSGFNIYVFIGIKNLVQDYCPNAEVGFTKNVIYKIDGKEEVFNYDLIIKFPKKTN